MSEPTKWTPQQRIDNLAAQLHEERKSRKLESSIDKAAIEVLSVQLNFERSGRRWANISTAPTDHREILVCFRGVLRWIRFIAIADGINTRHTDYAKPTHWTDLLDPPQ
jgi:hypothetical protein